MAADRPTRDYLFNRNHRSSARLNLLHGLYTQLAGHLLHPRIPSILPSWRIADIGTGTGIWCIDVASRVPASVHIEGLDISADRFPHPSFLPANVRFRAHDAYEQFPADMIGQFDVVAVRFLVTVVDCESLDPLIRNIATLLKPGGYIQWSEPDNTTVEVVASDPRATHDSLSRLAGIMKKPSAKAQTEWVLGLGTALSGAGFEDIIVDRYPVPLSYTHYFTQINILTTEDVRTGNARHAEEFEDIGQAISQLNDELKGGAGIRWAFQCVVARLPAS